MRLEKKASLVAEKVVSAGGGASGLTGGVRFPGRETPPAPGKAPPAGERAFPAWDRCLAPLWLLDLSMRQVHKAGEKLFVDYCGQTVPVTDPSTGESYPAQIFVAVQVSNL